MNTLRNTCAVAILTLILAISTSAGQIQCPGVVSGGGGTSSTSNSETTSTIPTSDVTTSIILAVSSVVS